MMLWYLEQTTNFFGSWAPIIQLLKSNVFLKKTLKLSNEDIIGSGEYGTIYILTQDDTMAFPVKRLNRGSADRDQRFEREIEAMGDIKHRNIVTLNGYYTAPHCNLLIYELVADEGLDGVLHDHYPTSIWIGCPDTK